MIAIYYENVEITGSVMISKCVHHEAMAGRCDLCELELEQASQWFDWRPAPNDRIEIQMDGYSTGQLYISAVMPRDGKFSILAASIPTAVRQQRFFAHQQQTLGQIIALCAAECAMESRVYGLDSGLRYPFLLRRGESAPAFLHRILEMERGFFRVFSGRFTAISLEAVCAAQPAQTIELDAGAMGYSYTRRDDLAICEATVQTPYALCRVCDPRHPSGRRVVYTDLPALDPSAAGRWARNLMVMHNLGTERLEIYSEFNPGFRALDRMDILGEGGLSGEWIVAEAWHDFVNRTSRAVLIRGLAAQEQE